MSDKLISLESVLKETRRFKGYIDDDMIERLSLAFKRLPPAELPMNAVAHIDAVPKEMSAVEYARDIEMLCAENLLFGHCNQNCPILIAKDGQPCSKWIMTHPEEAVAIVEKWVQEHPERSGECRE